MSRTDLLRAQLDVPADGTVIRFSLVDAQGVVQLRRALPSPGRGRPVADCMALAETLAAIVERYFSSVPLETEETDLPQPPPPPVASPLVIEPPKPVARRGPSVFVSSAWRATTETTAAFELGAGATLGLTKGRVRLAALLRLGIEQSQDATPVGATASLRRFGARAGLVMALPAGPGTFEPTVALGADTYLGLATIAKNEILSLRASPVAEVEAGYRVALGGYLYLRPHAGGGLAFLQYNVVTGEPNRPQSAIFKTPTWFSTVGLDIGLVFR